MDDHDTIKSTAKRKCAHQIYYEWVPTEIKIGPYSVILVNAIRSSWEVEAAQISSNWCKRTECKAHAHTECVQEEKGRSRSYDLHLEELHTSG